MTRLTTLRRRTLRTAPKLRLHPVTLLRRERVAPAVDSLLRQPESAGQIDWPTPEKLDCLLLRHTREYGEIYFCESSERQEMHTKRENDRVNTFGERLSEAMRLAGGIKQAELARAIGCTKATIGQAVNGQTERLSAQHSMRAAQVLDVDPAWLILGEGEARPLQYRERRSLSARAIYIGMLLDAIVDPERNARAYALVVQLLEFNA